MKVRCFWPNCTYRNGDWGAAPVDCFWVEATPEEAAGAVFPLMPAERAAASRELAERYGQAAALMGNPAAVHCFLVARDLSSIDPHQPHYPIANLWNAYSPFRAMPEVEVSDLSELRELRLPSVDD